MGRVGKPSMAYAQCKTAARPPKSIEMRGSQNLPAAFFQCKNNGPGQNSVRLNGACRKVCTKLKGVIENGKQQFQQQSDQRPGSA